MLVSIAGLLAKRWFISVVAAKTLQTYDTMAVQGLRTHTWLVVWGGGGVSVLVSIAGFLATHWLIPVVAEKTFCR